MTASTKLEILVSRDGDVWRLYVHGWIMPSLREMLDGHREALLQHRPEPSELEQYLCGRGAAYDYAPTLQGGFMITTVGRSTVVLSEWLSAELYAANAR